MAGDYVIRWPLNMAQVAVSDGNLHPESASFARLGATLGNENDRPVFGFGSVTAAGGMGSGRCPCQGRA